MANYFQMEKQDLLTQKQNLEKEYQKYCDMKLQLDMSRGKPGPEQLDISMDILDIKDYIGKTGIDARNYGFLEGMPEARELFAQLMEVKPSEVIVGGNASLQLMYFMVELAYRTGFPESEKPWSTYSKPKFICPAPGYDRHFRITQHFGFDLVTVDMTEAGPDMDMVEKLVANDDSIKGIWCVPKYSNPDGYTYSNNTVTRLATMKTAANDFKIFWDNAYCVHDIAAQTDELANIMQECKANGTEKRVLEFCSTSKITFSGSGVGAMAACEDNIKFISANMFPMTISFDKLNQLRHVVYFNDVDGIKNHMKKHTAILKPKFEKVLEVLGSTLTPCGDIAHWTKPNGGYFVSLYSMPGTAKKVVQMCKEAGVVLTDAGAAYPYGNDPQDSNIRIAPSYPPVSELELATGLLSVCVRIATIEKLLEKQS